MNLFRKKIRTRFAPSPTGQLHVGSLRTALYSYLFAKQNKGDFILRIEDTDKERFVSGATENLAKILNLFDLKYDEGFDVKGKYGPYIQSQRLDIYKKYAQELIDKDKAYYCFCSSKRLDQLRDEQKKNKQAPQYDRRCLNLAKDEIFNKLANNENYVIRLKVPEGETVFQDIIRGEIKINNKNIDDQVLIKSDGYPTYHMAVVVDDYLMKITHIIRGDEWIPSTPKHVILYDAFGWNLPNFAHLPLLLNPDKSKLSKRQGDVAVEDYLAKGYLPEALLNFVSLLGWNPGDDREMFSLEELIKEFKLEKVQKSGAVFNLEKLNWMNSQYIKNTKSEKLLNHYLKTPFKNHLEFIDGFDKDKYDLIKIINLFKERLNKLEDLTTKAQFIYELNDYDADLLIFKKSDKEKTILAIKKALDIIEPLDNNQNAADLRKIFDEQRELAGLTRAEMFWPLRVAVSGSEKSPDVFDLIEVLGKIETKKRFDKALEKINKI